jgi:hypothetical protein
VGGARLEFVWCLMPSGNRFRFTFPESPNRKGSSIQSGRVVMHREAPIA